MLNRGYYIRAVFVFTFLLFFLTPFLISHAEGVTFNVGYQNPLSSGISDIPQFIKKVIDIVLDIGVPLVVLAIIFVGFTFITAQGNEEKIKTAKSGLGYTLLGSALLLGAWVLASAITSPFSSTSTVASSNPPPAVDTTTTTQTQPTSDDNEGVLFIGGSYDEENPVPNTCSNPPSKPIAEAPKKNTWALIPKAYADDLDAEKVEASQRALEFRTARCWLIYWYKNRKVISDPALQTAFNQVKPKILSGLQSLSFEILSTEAYKKKYGEEEVGGFTHNGTKIAMRYSDSDMTSAAINQLTRYAEDNGLRITTVENNNISNVLSANTIISVFDEAWSDIDSTDEFNPGDKLKDNINYYYCLVLEGQHHPCYFGTQAPSKELSFPPTDPITYDEVTARLMEIRYKHEFEPDRDLTFDEAKGAYMFSNLVNFSKDHISDVGSYDDDKIVGLSPEDIEKYFKNSPKQVKFYKGWRFLSLMTPPIFRISNVVSDPIAVSNPERDISGLVHWNIIGDMDYCEPVNSIKNYTERFFVVSGSPYICFFNTKGKKVVHNASTGQKFESAEAARNFVDDKVVTTFQLLFNETI